MIWRLICSLLVRGMTLFASGTHTTRLDLSFVAGAVIAIGAVVAGMISTGLTVRSFLQLTGALIVLGGTLGVFVLSTPRDALLSSLSRTLELFFIAPVRHEKLLEDIVQYARIARREGVTGLEPYLEQVPNRFLRESLEKAVDISVKDHLRTILETEVRLRERRGEADAKTLEVAGGFAPTIGIIGTVVGLIEVMSRFSDLQSVGAGIGMAFVSTIYGLALANLILLPAANRIRARVAANFETEEMTVEGVMCIAERLHPTLIRMRLQTFVLSGRPRLRVDEQGPLAVGARAGS